MITLQEAIKIAENAGNKGLLLYQITEYPDRYVFDYGLESGESLINSVPPYVMKDTGETGVFFPPDYDDDYYNSGIDIPVPENLPQ